MQWPLVLLEELSWREVGCLVRPEEKGFEQLGCHFSKKLRFFFSSFSDCWKSCALTFYRIYLLVLLLGVK